MDLGIVRERERLKESREPHWQKLATGQYLGFRRSKTGKSGTWIARFYDSDTGKQLAHSLGDLGHLAPNERFTAASAEARAWFDHVSGGGSRNPITVREACERYAQDHPDAAGRFPRYVYTDPIASVKLLKLTDRHVREWRKRLEALPALVTRNKKGPVITRTRSAATVNRDMVPFRAALNMALDHGEVLTARAWRKALQPGEAKGRRNLFLDKEQRRAFLRALPADIEAFCHALCLLPLRPGALASLRVADLDTRTLTLTVERDKSGNGRKILLPLQTAVILKDQTKSKLPAAPLFARADGSAWNRDAWKLPIKEAARVANLPRETTAYTLRHSTITDLVAGGLDLLTVAQVSGTSVAMIERHYGHLQRERAAAALAELAL